MSEELLPCPFCGETTDNGFLAHKGYCYLMQKVLGANPEILKTAWNTRSQPKYKRVDLENMMYMGVFTSNPGSNFTRGYNQAIDDIKSKYGDLYVVIEK